MSLIPIKSPLGAWVNSPLGARDGIIELLVMSTIANVWRLTPGVGVRWAYDTGADGSQITIDSSGNAYTTSGNTVLSISSSGLLRWTVDFSPLTPLAVSYYDGKLYVGAGRTASSSNVSGTLYWLDPSDGSQQASVQPVSTSNVASSSPRVSWIYPYASGVVVFLEGRDLSGTLYPRMWQYSHDLTTEMWAGEPSSANNVPLNAQGASDDGSYLYVHGDQRLSTTLWRVDKSTGVSTGMGVFSSSNSGGNTVAKDASSNFFLAGGPAMKIDSGGSVLWDSSDGTFAAANPNIDGGNLSLTRGVVLDDGSPIYTMSDPSTTVAGGTPALLVQLTSAGVLSWYWPLAGTPTSPLYAGMLGIARASNGDLYIRGPRFDNYSTGGGIDIA